MKANKRVRALDRRPKYSDRIITKKYGFAATGIAKGCEDSVLIVPRGKHAA